MKLTQAQRILKVLRESNGWVSSRRFVFDMKITQYNKRISELRQEGHDIESEFRDLDRDFKCHRLVEKTGTRIVNWCYVIRDGQRYARPVYNS